MPNLVFSGHDTFHCRQFWLKKAYDFVLQGKEFAEPMASLNLGVGKNMVTAIRYWGKAFEILKDNDRPTELAINLLNDDGWDPYLEDIGSLWLLHYKIVSSGNGADLFGIIFNEFARKRPEFRLENVLNYIEQNKEGNFNSNTLKKDFTVFCRTYYADFEDKDIEESFTGILTELNLLKKVSKTLIDADGQLRTSNMWLIEKEIRGDIPLEVLLYVILSEFPGAKSISLEQLYETASGPGCVFCLSKEGLALALENLANRWPEKITFSSEAGIRELQLKAEMNKDKVIASYYGR